MINSFSLFSEKNNGCKGCGMASICPLSSSLKGRELDVLSDIVRRRHPLKKGDYIFRQHDDFKSLFAIRTGVVKTFELSDSGEEQIIGFHLPSELIGISGVSGDRYPISAQALETTTCCEIPFARLDEAAARLPKLRKRLIGAMGTAIKADQKLIWMLSKDTAEARLAKFLISLSARFDARGFSARRMRLSMLRSEIGNYLGLALETVSRSLSRLQNKNFITVEGREVVILDYEGLRSIYKG